MAALDLPPIPLGLPPADPNVAEAQAQQRRLAAQQTEQQQQQAQLQRTNLENQTAGKAQLAQTAAADSAQWGVNGYTGPDGKGASFGAQAPEFRQHMIDAYGPIAEQIPGIVNSTQRAITNNPDIGVPAIPAGSPVTETIGPDGQTHRSFQTISGQSDAPAGELPTAQENIAQAIANRQFNMQALPRNPQQRTQILSRVTQIDPNFDEKLYPVQQAVQKSFTSGPDAANIASANTAVGHINDFLKAGQALNNSTFTPWNAVANTFEGATGNPAQTTFASKATAIADELAKLFKGTGAASDSAIKDWKATLSPNMSPAQIQASAQSAMELMASRLAALQEKYRSGLGKDPDRPFLSPRSQAILRSNGLAIPTGQEQSQDAAQPAPASTADPRAELAKQALADPNATEAHKAAARQILGLQ